MASVVKFEDLDVWKEGVRLASEIYRALKDCRDFGLRDQIERAAVSVPSNIAEGFDRKTNKEFIQFLFIAKGSASELRTQLYLAIDLSIIDKEKANELIERTRKISAMLMNLIKTRQTHFQ
jgi:four helix bundle protein